MSVDEQADAVRLAQRLRDTREYLDLSQQFVSDQTGIPRSAISDIERGERRVDSLELKRLAAGEHGEDLADRRFAAEQGIGSWPERRHDETTAIGRISPDQFFQ